MKQPIIFPDVELWATGYLRTNLPSYGYSGVYISNERKNQTRAIWVRRDGGPQLDVVRQAARLGVNVFDRTEQGVTDLARTVSALLVAAPDGDPVLNVQELSGPSPIPDDSGPRRFMTFEITVRGVALSTTP